MAVFGAVSVLFTALSVMAFFTGLGNGSHFRGGTISCEPVLDSTTNGGIMPNGNFKITCSFRIAWRRSYNSGTRCTTAQRNRQELIDGPGARLNCASSGCSGTIDRLNFYCTEFSSTEDWTQGSRSFEKTFSASVTEMTYRMSGCCWIGSLVVGGSTFNWGTTFSLVKRSDTGALNHSPRTAALPIVRLQSGCKSVIPIPMADSDGDVVRCRWASGVSECGGVCNAVPGATLKSNPCELTFTPTRRSGLYAAALSIEDFPRDNPSGKRISVVPLQFLIHVYSSNVPCAVKPKLIDPSPADGSCVPVPPLATYTATLAALSTSSGVAIDRFKLLPPVGMTQGSLQTSINGSQSEGKLVVTWTPTPSQYGQQFVFCFSAEDSNGQSTNQTCLFLLAGASPPLVVPGSQHPNTTENPLAVPRIFGSFSLDFDQQVYKPLTPRYIRIFERHEDSSSRQVHAIDVSVSPDVFIQQHPIHQKQYRFSFIITHRLNIFSDFFILIDKGAIVGDRSCGKGGSPWDGISDPTYWTFSTNDQVGNYTDCGRFSSQMLDFGSTMNDEQLTLGNGSSCQKLQITSGSLPLWGAHHQKLSVCENGQILMDLDTAIRHPQFLPASWSTQPTLFAPYWCTADNSYSKTLRPGVRSHVWYHQYKVSPLMTSSERQMLKAIGNLVTAKYRANETSSFKFQATWALVTTWERISPYPSTYGYQMHNTFQAILATDGLRSFALYAYDENSIQWSVLQAWDPQAKYGNAIVGFTSPNHHYSDPRSSTRAIAFVDNYPDDGNRYLFPQPCTSGAMYIFQLYKEADISGSESKCKHWHVVQPEPSTWTRSLPSCPCTLDQVMNDGMFREVFHKSQVCFQSVAPTEQGSVQECCYHTTQPGLGALLVGEPDGGIPQRFSSLTDPLEHQSSEVDAHRWCCQDTNLCDLFYNKRPSQMCKRYQSPGLAICVGSKFTTFDGTKFIFNCPGEFTLLLLKTSVGSTTFTLQGRTAVLPPSVADGYATAFVAFCTAGLYQPRIQVQIVTSVSGMRQMAVFINGKDFFAPVIKSVIDDDSPGGRIMYRCDFLGQNCKQFDPSKSTPTPTNTFFLPKPGVYVQGNVTINVHNSTYISLVFSFGIVINVCYRSPGILVMSQQLPAYMKQQNLISGLLGDWNSRPSDDLKVYGGSTILSNSSLREIHNTYGLSWLTDNVDNKTSLFTNIGFPAGSNFSASYSRQFNASFDTGLTKPRPGVDPRVITTMCAVDMGCTWDSGHYLKLTDVQALKNSSDQLDEGKRKLDHFPPIFVGPIINRWKVDVTKSFGSQDKPGSGKTYIPIIATNPMNPKGIVHIQLGGTVPRGLSIQIISNATGHWSELSWDGAVLQALTGTIRLSFFIIATDPMCGSRILRPTIDVCECLNGGKCSQQTIKSQQDGVLSFAPCTCTDAYSGVHCEKDKDGCEAAFQPCFSGVSCADVKAPGVGYKCGPCPAGFSGNGQDCFDIDECLVNSTLCQQQCINTQTGYECGCFAGYKLNVDKRTCTDVDECGIRRHNCQQMCINTPGSFQCSCYQGYKVNADNVTCSAISSCPLSDLYECDQFCSREGSSAVCSCGSGWSLSTNNKACQDVDECRQSVQPCQGTCTNTVGSFNCSCSPGYQLAADQSSCEDIDECLTPPCFRGQLCLNTPGSYRCTCPTGYRTNGFTQTCEAVECGRPYQPPNSILRGSVFTYLQTVDYICQTGYYISGRTSLRCEWNGEWNGAIPQCLPIPCRNLTTPANGKIGKHRSSYGGVAQFSCNPGWQVVGSTSLVCLSSGLWNSSEPVCGPALCPVITAPTNGRFVHFNRFYTGNVTITCNTGYEPAYPNKATIICRDRGKWSDSLSNCQDTNECQQTPKPCQQTCKNIIGSFICICSSGYQLAADQSSCEDVNECLSSPCFRGQQCRNLPGTFRCTCPTGYRPNANTKMCEAVDCGKPNQPPNSILQGSDFTYLQTVGYRCETGYYISGSTSRRCEANGGWSGTIPRCLPKPCRSLVPPANGKIGKHRSSFGGLAQFSCNPGWRVVGSKLLACLSSGQWNGSEPVCQIVRCPVLSAPIHGGIIHYSRYYMGNATITCDLGYEPTSPDKVTVFCQDGGGWSSSPSKCQDANECTKTRLDKEGRKVGYCHPKAECSNSVGSYTCTCLNGYVGNGKMCENINECEQSAHTCPASARCVDTNGGFLCVCSNNYLAKNGACGSDLCKGGQSGSSTSSNSTNVETIVLAVVVVILVLIIVIGGAFIRRGRFMPLSSAEGDKTNTMSLEKLPSAGGLSIAIESRSNPSYTAVVSGKSLGFANPGNEEGFPAG